MSIRGVRLRLNQDRYGGGLPDQLRQRASTRGIVMENCQRSGICGTFNVDVCTDVERVGGVCGCQAQESCIVVVCFHADTDAVERNALASGANQVGMSEQLARTPRSNSGELGPRLLPPKPGPESETNWKSRIWMRRTPVESSATHSAFIASRAASPAANRRACDFIAAVLLIRYSLRLKTGSLRRNHQGRLLRVSNQALANRLHLRFE